MQVLLGKLSIDIEHTLTECCDVIKRVGGTPIHRNVLADTHSKPLFQVKAGPVHVNDVFTNLENNGLKFHMIFKDRMGAICHAFNGEAKLTSIICMGEARLECLNEFIKGGELGGRCIFRYEPEFCRAGKEGHRSFHLFFFIGRCRDVCMNLEDPGIDDGKGYVLS